MPFSTGRRYTNPSGVPQYDTFTPNIPIPSGYNPNQSWTPPHDYGATRTGFNPTQTPGSLRPGPAPVMGGGTGAPLYRGGGFNPIGGIPTPGSLTPANAQPSPYTLSGLLGSQFQNRPVFQPTGSLSTFGSLSTPAGWTPQNRGPLPRLSGMLGRMRPNFFGRR